MVIREIFRMEKVGSPDIFWFLELAEMVAIKDHGLFLIVFIMLVLSCYFTFDIGFECSDTRIA